MARKKRRRRAYATDLTDGQWALIAPFIPEAEAAGRSRKAPRHNQTDNDLLGMAFSTTPLQEPPLPPSVNLRAWQTLALDASEGAAKCTKVVVSV